MIGEIRQNFTEVSALVGLILATALNILLVAAETVCVRLIELRTRIPFITIDLFQSGYYS